VDAKSEGQKGKIQMKKHSIKQEVVAALIVAILISAANAIKHIYHLDEERFSK
jgi:hypothetical protein